MILDTIVAQKRLEVERLRRTGIVPPVLQVFNDPVISYLPVYVLPVIGE